MAGQLSLFHSSLKEMAKPQTKHADRMIAILPQEVEYDGSSSNPF